MALPYKDSQNTSLAKSKGPTSPLRQQSRRWYETTPAIVGALVLIFMALSYLYFYPAAFEGRALFQMDGAAASGTGRDVKALEEATGEVSRWTGSLFGGMPTYQISPSYPSVHSVRDVGELFRLEWPLDLMPGDTYLLFMMLVGGLIFFNSWGVKWSLSFLGAVAWTFSSYFLILIDAGHLWKLMALAYVPPTIAGLVWAFYRKRYIVGLAVTAIFTALQVYSNHIQMSYYFAFVMLAMVVAWGIEAGKKREWVHFSKAFCAILLGGVIGLLINSSNLYHTWEYQKETMRGGRDITVLDGKEGVDKSINAEGLDRSYITQWSYGIDEMWTFLIPDAKGGYSAPIGSEPVLQEGLQGHTAQFVAQQNRYWGDQPFTAGPVYVGAFLLFLGVFGAFALKGPMKWALLVVTFLTIMLSWGHNFPLLTNFFIDYFPLYDKFRTPSSILVVAELTIPLFAVMGLSLILSEKESFWDIKRYRTPFYLASALTLGLTLLLFIFPSLSGGFLSDAERISFASYASQYPEVGEYVNALERVRRSLFQADALRSCVILAFGILVMYLYGKGKIRKAPFLIAVTLFVIVDLWSVDKRYLNDDKYLPKAEVQARATNTTEVDKMILKDTTQYRVMNLAVNTFNDATTSYNHRSIGGYHAAKLQRYQDVVEGYLSKMDRNVLRALNTKYYIVPDSVRGLGYVMDTEAYGSAWFVSEIHKAQNADEEFQAIGQIPLDDEAVVATPFTEGLSETYHKDSLSKVTLIDYRPNLVTYRTENSGKGFAVFSEVYYPHGWSASIDGKEAPIIRTNYILRGLEIPEGVHDVTLSFDPKSLDLTETVSFVAQIILLLIVLWEVWRCYARNKVRNQGEGYQTETLR